MAGRRARAGLALAALGLSLAGCGGSQAGAASVQTVTLVRTTTVTHTVTTTRTTATPAPCSGDLLSGTFAEIPGSSGAGQIEYALKLTNTSHGSCLLGGIGLQLLDASGAFLPTHPGSGPGGHVTLAPGASAVATARFSPDVSGQGDSQAGPCQPTAHTLRVSPFAGGAVDAPVKPPTSVCEQGRLEFQPFAAG